MRFDGKFRHREQLAGRNGMITKIRSGRPDRRMRRDYHNWFSPRLGRHMELLAYGHSGDAGPGLSDIAGQVLRI